MIHTFSETLLPVLQKSELHELTKQVKETMLNYIPEKKDKKFTEVDLWNIHRNRKAFRRERTLRSY